MTTDETIEPAHEQEQFNLALLEGFVDLLQFQLAQLANQLTELQIGPTDRLIRHHIDSRSGFGLRAAPEHIAKDIDQVERIALIRAVAKKVDQAAEAVLAESRRVWRSVEYIAGNVHKITFGTPVVPPGLDGSEPAPPNGAKSRKLLELATQLVQQAAVLQNSLAELHAEAKP